MATFEWDEGKSLRNRDKHGVTFEEAATVFGDPNAVEEHDEAHSCPGEDRFRIIGRSAFPRLLLVVYCERVVDVIRIISARPANSRERGVYGRR